MLLPQRRAQIPEPAAGILQSHLGLPFPFSKQKPKSPRLFAMHEHCASPRGRTAGDGGLFLKMTGTEKGLSQLAEEPSLVLGSPRSGREVRALVQC